MMDTMRRIPETSPYFSSSSPTQHESSAAEGEELSFAVPMHMLSKKSIISFPPAMMRKNQSTPALSGTAPPSSRSNKLDILLADPAKSSKPWDPPTNPLLAGEREVHSKQQISEKTIPSRKSKPKFFHKSDSTPNMMRSRRASKNPKVMRRKLSSGSSAAAGAGAGATKAARSLADVHPNEFLTKFLQAKKLQPRNVSYREMENFFLEITPERLAYDMDLVRAIRNEDIETLQEMSQHRNLECCNKFGESIVHTACRRQSARVLQFLLDKKVDIRVACEMGRNPLHDTCWTTDINFDVVKLLLEVCPDFLYICDNRNLTPLSYISSQEQWLAWNHFLLKNQELLLPKYLTFESVA
jgi:hypothetical protein